MKTIKIDSKKLYELAEINEISVNTIMIKARLSGIQTKLVLQKKDILVTVYEAGNIAEILKTSIIKLQKEEL